MKNLRKHNDLLLVGNEINLKQLNLVYVNELFTDEEREKHTICIRKEINVKH